MSSLYWVGGTGNWSSGANWSAVSGGAGGAGPPSSSTDVFFDANSGSGVSTVDVLSSCLSVDCTGFTGTLAGNNILVVSGTTFRLSAGMTVTFSGTVEFTTGSSAAITMAGQVFPGGLIFFGTGAWTLQDDLNCSGPIQLVEGTFTANGHNVTCSGFSHANPLPSVLNMGSGTWTITAGGDCFDVSQTGLTINASTSTLVFNCGSNAVTQMRLSAAATSGTVTLNNLTITGPGTGGASVRGANSASVVIAGTVRILKTVGNTIDLFNSAGITYGSIDCSGATIVLLSTNAGTIRSSLTLDTGVTLSWTGGLTFNGSGLGAITSTGKTFGEAVTFDGTGSWTLQDDFVTSAALQLQQGSFAANGHNVTCLSFSHTASSSALLSMGTGTWTLTGTGTVWDATGSNLTVAANTSTIKINDGSSSDKTFAGNGSVYSNIWLTGGGTGKLIITGNNTFGNVKVDSGRTVAFADGSSTTVSSLTTSGSTMTKQTSATYSLTITGGITMGLSAMTIDHCDCVTPNTFYAGASSTDGGNNTNVIFLDVPVRKAAVLPILVSPIDKSKLRASF
jgi:fibronectin-binding autotransporter adhesin